MENAPNIMLSEKTQKYYLKFRLWLYLCQNDDASGWELEKNIEKWWDYNVLG